MTGDHFAVCKITYVTDDHMDVCNIKGVIGDHFEVRQNDRRDLCPLCGVHEHA